jgi:hypothetical protein
MADFIRKTVDTFGRELSVSEIRMAEKFGLPGEVVISPEAIESQFNLRAEMMSDTLAGVAAGKNLDQATADALEILSGKVTTEGLDALGSSKVYAIPKAVSKKVNQEVKLQLGSSVRIFWDKPMNVWKASVLSFTPRWVINNFFGNAIYIGLENPGAFRHVLAQLSEKNEAAARILLGENAIREVESGFYHGLASTSFAKERDFGVVSTVEGAVPGGKAVVAASRGVKRGLGWWTDWVRNFNSRIEEAARRGVLIDNLRRQALTQTVGNFYKDIRLMEKIASQGADKAMMSAALRGVDRTLGNFMTYNPIEQGIVRRFIMPFYGFYRHNAKVMALLPLEHPLKGRVLELLNEMDKQFEKDLPSYEQGQGTMFLGDIFGKDTFIRLRNLNPLSQFTQENPIAGLFNPVLKIAIERISGTDTFTGEPFKPHADQFEDRHGQVWQIERDGNGNVVGVVRREHPLPPLLTHIFGQFGGVNMIPGFKLYPKASWLQLAGMAGAPLYQPRTSAASSLAFDQQMQMEALATAQKFDPGTGEYIPATSSTTPVTALDAVLRTA